MIPKTKAEQVAKISRRARKIFRKEDVEKWLYSKIRILRGRRPIDLLGTARGYREVDSLLDSIESGAFL
jgi:uncharacterized protein (DUF2384 family)